MNDMNKLCYHDLMSLQFIQASPQISTYSTKNYLITVTGVTGLVKMVTQDLHIPVTRQDRL